MFWQKLQRQARADCMKLKSIHKMRLRYEKDKETETDAQKYRNPYEATIFACVY